jgi:hypothetical protein
MMKFTAFHLVIRLKKSNVFFSARGLQKFSSNEDTPQQATGYPKEDSSEPARSELRGIAPKEIEIKGVIQPQQIL